MIEFNDCTIELSKTFSLSDISWRMARSEIWAVLGPNGSGKSAFLDSIAGAGDVTHGSRSVSAEKVALVSLEEQARLIAREKERDDSDLTDEISEGTPTRVMIDEVSENRNLKEALVDSFSLTGLLDRGFRKLSTGETRKILLIRALTSDPELLLLDEPFEGLDTASVQQVKRILGDLAADSPMIMAFNRVEEVPDFVTHVLYLEKGRIRNTFSCEQYGSIDAVKRVLSQLTHMKSRAIELPEPENVFGPRLNADGALVGLRDARVAYTENLVFEGLSWEIRPGEHWQISGPNGSGKTCLLNLITGDHPQCYVNDIEVFGYKRGHGETIWDIKKYIGYVSTALHWDYRLGVGVRNVVISGFYDSIGLYHKANDNQRQIADAWLALLGMSGKAGDPFSRLSYGEQRLLLIARAMVKHPPLLLLDEPCLGLDDLNRQLVLALVERVCEEGNTTVVYVTHHDEDEVPSIHNRLRL